MKTGFRSIPRFLLPLSSLQPLKARHPPTFQCFNAVSRSRPSLQACLSARNPSTSQSRCLASDAKSQSSKKTVQQLAARNRSGPFSIRAALVFLVAGAGLTVYFRYERTRMERKRVAEATKGVGKPKIGGHFDLIDHNEEPFSDGDMKGGFSIVYFGFTHCPDICPEELDKLAKIIDLVSANSAARISLSSFPNVPSSPSPSSPISPSTPSATSNPLASSPSSQTLSSQPQPSQPSQSRHLSSRAPLLPVFITCDPARDTPGILKTYLAEFHPGIIGLTGSWQQVKDVCKMYRVYFSTPEGATAGSDYLVDHSIYFYLMDPDGDFVEAIGRQHSPERASQIITEHMSDWRNGKKIR